MSKIQEYGPLRLALPSKGRLFEAAVEFLATLGYELERKAGDRSYLQGIAGNQDVVVELVSAGEIPRALEDGRVHAGITGIDLVAESLGDRRYASPGSVHTGGPEQLVKLGFGRAHLEVAVPRAWIDVETVQDLLEVAVQLRRSHNKRLRVATKYLRLTRQFFSESGIADYKILSSPGATEAAPAAGTADIIVDITSSGQTLAANHLKTVQDGRILSSEAALFRSVAGPHLWTPRTTAQMDRLVVLARARLAARRTRILRAFGSLLRDPDAVRQAASEAGAHTVSILTGTNGQPAASIAECYADEARVYDVLQVFKACGFEHCSVTHPDMVFTSAALLSGKRDR